MSSEEEEEDKRRRETEEREKDDIKTELTIETEVLLQKSLPASKEVQETLLNKTEEQCHGLSLHDNICDPLHSSHCTRYQSSFHTETTLSSPTILSEEEIMNALQSPNRLLLINQFDHASSQIKDILLTTSISSDPTTEVALSFSQNQSHSTSTSFIATEKFELTRLKEENPLASPIIESETMEEKEEVWSQSSDEAVFEEYWEEVVIHHYQQEQWKTQDKRLQLLHRIQEGRMEETKRCSDRIYKRSNSHTDTTMSIDSSMNSPHSLDWRTEYSPGETPISNMRKEKEEDGLSSHEELNIMKEGEMREEWIDQSSFPRRVMVTQQVEETIRQREFNTETDYNKDEISRLNEGNISEIEDMDEWDTKGNIDNQLEGNYNDHLSKEDESFYKQTLKIDCENNFSSHTQNEICEVIHDQMEKNSNQLDVQENTYQDIDQLFPEKRESYANKRDTHSSEIATTDFCTRPRWPPIHLNRRDHRGDSGEYIEIETQTVGTGKEKKVKIYNFVEQNEVENGLPIALPIHLPAPTRDKGSFVEMMAHVWDGRLLREGERRINPRKIAAPKRKDFQPDEHQTDVVKEEVFIRPHQFDISSISNLSRPRIHSIHSFPFLDTLSIKTNRFDPVEGRSELKKELNDFYPGDVTVVTNDGMHQREKNPYGRNEYEEIVEELLPSPHLECLSRNTQHSIRVASKTNQWEEKEEMPMERCNSFDRESSLSFPRNSQSSNSRKKSVTFAPESQLVNYRDMHEYTLREEYGKTRVEKVEKGWNNGVSLIESTDLFTRKETKNGQSVTCKYERSERREDINSLILRDNIERVGSHSHPSSYNEELPISILSPHPSPQHSYHTHTSLHINHNNKHLKQKFADANSSDTLSQSVSSHSESIDGSSPIYASVTCDVPLSNHTPQIPFHSQPSMESSISTENINIEREKTQLSPLIKSNCNDSNLATSSESLVNTAMVVLSPNVNLSLTEYSSISHPPIDYSHSSFSSSLSQVSVDTQTLLMRLNNGELEVNGDASIQMEDKSISHVSSLSQWDPTPLIKRLYEVSYEPRMETKRSRFINMEGHIEVPNEELEDGFERKWIAKYVKTRDGRLQFFVTHYANENPVEEKILSGADIEISRDERTITIIGGRQHLKITLRVPSALLDKWRHALLSHSASSYIDAYVRPIPSSLPHINQRVLILELGGCSIRGGVLTNDPSLPSSFFPSIASILPNGEIIVGCDAYLPKNRLKGRLDYPLYTSDPTLEPYTLNKDVMRACVQKVTNDCKIDPNQFKILISLSQNIPSVLIENIMKILLEDLHFQAAAVTRQPSLVLYSYDVSTGVVVDIGDRLSIIPVVDGYMVEHGTVSLPHGGRQIHDALRRGLLKGNNGEYGHDNIIDSLLLRNIMEETSFVSQDAANEKENKVTISLSAYSPLPSMPKQLNVDNSRFLATEGLFYPKKWNLEGKGLHQLIHESIQKSPIDSRRVLYRNIYLAGGASLLPGLAERLETELSNIVPNTIHSQVHISPWRYNAAFLGAQVIASSASFDDSLVTIASLTSFIDKLHSTSF